MLLPSLWLNDYCDPGLDVKALEERLTMTGTKVERLFAHGVGARENFVVGRVLSAEQHPDADRLTVCMVALGEGDTAQIVCGAPNVAEGQTVAVARPGAVMPGGVKLKKAKLRGVESDGMILAEDEVAIGTLHDGIMVLDDDLLPGTPLEDVLPIATDVFELEITPNRPDCLSVYGVAREVHAATRAPLAPPPWADDPMPADGDVPGHLDRGARPRAVPALHRAPVRGREAGRVAAVAEGAADGGRPAADLQRRRHHQLRDAVHRPADACLRRRPDRRRPADRAARAAEGERITTLDDVERTLDPDVCVIEDAEGPTSIAGIMGGARSEVNDGTTRVLMEAATWNGPNIQRTSTRLGLRTEASGRFEKGLQPEQGIDGQALAAKLMIELCGARPAGGTIDVGGPGPAAATIRLREARVEGLLGAPIARAEQAEILARLGFETADAGDGLDVTVPYWRRDDVTREADLVEEVGRIWGFERLPLTLPSRRGVSGRLEPRQRLRRARRGRARRRRAVRDAGLELRGPVARGAPGAAGGRPAPPRRAPRQPDVRGAVGPAHDAARLAARQPPAQPLARPRGRAAVGARSGLPARAQRGREPGTAASRASTACRTSASTSPRCSPAACARPPGATPTRRARTSSPPRACSAR